MSRDRDTPSDSAAAYGCMIVLLVAFLICASIAALLVHSPIVRVIAETIKVASQPKGFHHD